MLGRRVCCVWSSIVALGVLADASPAQEQAPIKRRDTFWVGVGGGVGSEGVGANVNASYQFGANVISLRNSATSGLYSDGFWDFALLYGRAARGTGKRYHAAAALGLAVVDGCRGGDLFTACRDVSAAVGLPLEVQVFWRPGSLVGLGLYGFANLNRARSFAGLTLGLQLGRLR